MTLSLLLTLSCALQASTPEKQPLSIPILLEERAGVERTQEPVSGGIPIPKGQLREATPMLLAIDGEKIQVATWPLARWNDASISWLGVEFLSPKVPANGKLTGNLVPADSPTLIGPSISQPKDGSSLFIQNAKLHLAIAKEDAELFTVRGETLKGAIGIGFKAQTWSGPKPVSWAMGETSFERDTGGSVTLRREDSLVDNFGRPTIRFINRATVFQSSPLVHLQSTVEVLRGTHFAPTWEILFPKQQKPIEPWIARQIDENIAEINGDSKQLRLPGTFSDNSISVSVNDFWQMFPEAFFHDGNRLHAQLVSAKKDDHVVLEPGFARTKSLWLNTDTNSSLSENQLEALANSPLRPTTTPKWYCDSKAFGPLKPAKQNSNLLHTFRRSIEAVFSRAEKRGHYFGFQDWGDFLARDHTLSYYGHLDQEYDPNVALQLAFARTGDLYYLENSVRLASHYADVDTSHTGGVFQHRSTQRHLENWVADQLAIGIRKSMGKTGKMDGTVPTTLKLIQKQSTSLEKDVRRIIDLAKENGATNQELVEIAIQSTAHNLLLNIASKGAKNGNFGEIGPLDYANAVAKSSQGKQYGFKNVKAAFAPFFELYGGSWNDFPSFHQDNSHDPAIRHTGGHTLVESVVYAWLLTGDLRLRESLLRVARHHVETLVPQEIQNLQDRLKKKGNPPTRTVAWPLLNMCRLQEAVRNMPGQGALSQSLYQSCEQAASALLKVPVSRIESSIHAGVTLEALSVWHIQAKKQNAATYLVDLARYWASNHFDKRNRAFRYKSKAQSSSDTGFNGLLVYGLAYAQHLSSHPDLDLTLRSAWSSLAKIQKRAKAFAMTYRSVHRAAYFLE